MSDDAEDLWKSYLRGVKALTVPKKVEKKPQKVRLQARHPLKDFLSQLPLENVSRETLSPPKKAQLLSRRRTRNAQIEQRLDLHGLTLKKAYQELSIFLWTASRHGVRTVLIITGKGRGSRACQETNTPRMTLKEALPCWLQEPPLHSLVGSWSPAPHEQGGEGAFLIFLRASPLE